MVEDLSIGRITRLELRVVALPLRSPFATSTGVRARRDVLVVRVDGDDGTGWGECAAFADPGYTAETIGSAWHAISDLLGPPLARSGTLGELTKAWSAVPGERMAKAALETAVLDLLGRRLDRPLWALLGGQPRRMAAGVAIGVQSSTGALLEAVGDALDEGYSQVKLKVQPGWDVIPVSAVRERFPQLPLWVDANGAYRAADLPVLRRLDDLGLSMLEQPLPADDLAGLARLQSELRVAICLDESVASPADLERAAGAGAGRVLNLKPGRVGGVLAARALAAQARNLGWDVFVGGTLESSLGRTACLHLQTVPEVSLPGDLSAPSRYLARDLAARELQLDDRGCLPLPEGPGVGVEVHEEALAALTQRVEVGWQPKNALR